MSNGFSDSFRRVLHHHARTAAREPAHHIRARGTSPGTCSLAELSSRRVDLLLGARNRARVG
eukprot:CAMPEP_0119505448 /NCGR_PEP_ID=MMETSP1344-20130328/25989_1 /TAXON_ID=236787 /ORGANISM="Florenciella parvula, Strain CCMP2471" /LENGTH=61 /DNA_ID=CAMNT_0007541909 /DNA_START=77 /DNA_END=259 /DNA_ORIENTATION=-